MYMTLCVYLYTSVHYVCTGKLAFYKLCSFTSPRSQIMLSSTWLDHLVRNPHKIPARKVQKVIDVMGDPLTSFSHSMAVPFAFLKLRLLAVTLPSSSFCAHSLPEALLLARVWWNHRKPWCLGKNRLGPVCCTDCHHLPIVCQFVHEKRLLYTYIVNATEGEDIINKRKLALCKHNSGKRTS